MTNNGAFQQVEAFWQRVALATSKDKLPVTFHGAQAAAKGFNLLFTFNVQFNGKFFTIGGFFAFC
ncbi:hypothetical protein HR12_03990 [Microbacterium sp. SUBG005]|nr:hypothetical protein HR12_03990 [Microbacterium sp. SUBG005]